ncbi:NTP transferase domain-containing protein [Methanobrevibacter sp. DSM 116169]|uniref:NTP transferase domain-containing protein n=1 Tax=Methanobrevibacter sp. DSM 116169 TaxID=3242727 RepID=UPI0038FC6AD4
MVKAIIMAGGLGTRLKTDVEKPLFLFNDTYLIDYVINNLKESLLVNEIFVATSPYTPKTEEYIKNNDFLTIIDTPGSGFVNDLSFILDYFEKDNDSDTLLFINADLPLISANCIDYVLKKYELSDKNSLSVYIPSKFLDDLKIDYEYEFNGLVPSGLNILISQNTIQDEEELIISKVELAININSLADISVANKFTNF